MKMNYKLLRKQIWKGLPREAKRRGGFTLVEIIIAIGLFALIASMSIGAVITIFDANRRSESSKTVVDNLNYSIENMTRTVRFGTTYHCGINDTLSNPRDCNNGEDSLVVQFDVDKDGTPDTVVYRLCGTAIKRSDNGITDCNDPNMKAVTSSDTVIEYMKFYVIGSDESPKLKQPFVIVVIKGHVGNKDTLQSDFSIETMMSQRKLDI